MKIENLIRTQHRNTLRVLSINPRLISDPPIQAYLRTTLFLVVMALIDRVPGDLNLYIGGYVTPTIVSKCSIALRAAPLDYSLTMIP